MNKKGSILKIWCPHCQKQEMFKAIFMYPMSYNSQEKKEDWRCRDCVYTYNEPWFNKFFQFENFILREGEDPRIWLVLNNIPPEQVYEVDK